MDKMVILIDISKSFVPKDEKTICNRELSLTAP